MYLLVDDKRSLDSSEIDIIARNSQAAMEILLGMQGRLTGLILDYDLGEFETIKGNGGRHKREITGLDVLMFAIINKCLPLTVQIITQNPVGYKRLHSGLINDAKYVQKKICSHGKTRITYVQPDADEVVK